MSVNCGLNIRQYHLPRLALGTLPKRRSIRIWHDRPSFRIPHQPHFPDIGSLTSLSMQLGKHSAEPLQKVQRVQRVAGNCSSIPPPTYLASSPLHCTCRVIRLFLSFFYFPATTLIRSFPFRTILQGCQGSNHPSVFLTGEGGIKHHQITTWCLLACLLATRHAHPFRPADEAYVAKERARA